METTSDLTGQRFGSRTVIGRAPNKLYRYSNRHSQSVARWFCRCDCGHEGVVVGADLRKGTRSKCKACAMRKDMEKRKSEGSSPVKKGYKDHGLTAVYNLQTRQADRRNLIWILDFSLWKELSQQPCFYCGQLPGKRTKTTEPLNGLDRVNSDFGYCDYNVVPCCFECNLMKSNKSFDEFLKKIYKIAEFT